MCFYSRGIKGRVFMNIVKLVTLMLLVTIVLLAPPGLDRIGFPPIAQAQGSNFELISQTGGHTQTVALQGSYAYIDADQRLVILNVSNPSKPIVVGKTGMLPADVQDIVVSGNYAYIANG